MLGECLLALTLAAGQPLVFEGRGPGQGKNIVLVAGDQEYRSEESIPALARMLATRHGFRCTVLFPIDARTGRIDASVTDNIPGLQALRRADLAVFFLRFLELPDEQMKEIVDYTSAGRPIIGLRTSTHAFNYVKRKDSVYAKYSFRSRDPEGGWGRSILGETWIDHYGVHGKESTRATVAPGTERHPILKGVGDIWGESDVYAVTTLGGDSTPLLLGQPLMGMQPDSPANPAKKPLPVAWWKTYTGETGKRGRAFVTTMGHPADFRDADFRRLLANACYWALGMEDRIDARRSVEFTTPYNPSPIGMAKQK